MGKSNGWCISENKNRSLHCIHSNIFIRIVRMTKKQTKRLNEYYNLVSEFEQKLYEDGFPFKMNCRVSVWKRSWALNAWYDFVSFIESKYTIRNYDFSIEVYSDRNT
jgi:hypothetical protein